MDPLPPEVEPLRWLLGTWVGEGRGVYPTVDDFAYREESTFMCPGKPFVAYSQRTWAPDGSPLHSETGYLRPRDRGVEAVVAEPLGAVEVYAGTLDRLAPGAHQHDRRHHADREVDHRGPPRAVARR